MGVCDLGMRLLLSILWADIWQCFVACYCHVVVGSYMDRHLMMVPTVAGSYML